MNEMRIVFFVLGIVSASAGLGFLISPGVGFLFFGVLMVALGCFVQHVGEVGFEEVDSEEDEL